MVPLHNRGKPLASDLLSSLGILRKEFVSASAARTQIKRAVPPWNQNYHRPRICEAQQIDETNRTASNRRTYGSLRRWKFLACCECEPNKTHTQIGRSERKPLASGGLEVAIVAPYSNQTISLAQRVDADRRVDVPRASEALAPTPQIVVCERRTEQKIASPGGDTRRGDPRSL